MRVNSLACQTESYFELAAFGGNAGLAIGLVMLFAILMRQEREILRLNNLITGAEEPP